MTTATTLKLPQNLKARITTLAKAAGKTPHAFMVEALETQAGLAERRREFVATARAAEQEVAKYGLVYDADEVFAYVKDKIAGRKPKRLKPARLHKLAAAPAI